MVLAHRPFGRTPTANYIDSHTPDQFKFEALVSYMDRNVGLIYDKLSELSLLDNTLLIFTSDNTTIPSIVSSLNGTIIWGEKSTTLDSGTHVPFIMHLPGDEGGRVLDDLVSLTDVLPTLADATGLSVPGKLSTGWRELLGTTAGGDSQPRKWIYTTTFRIHSQLRLIIPRDIHPPLGCAIRGTSSITRESYLT